MSSPDPQLMKEARALLMKLHGATELGQRTEWIMAALLARDERAARIARWQARNGATAEQIATAILAYKEG